MPDFMEVGNSHMWKQYLREKKTHIGSSAHSLRLPIGPERSEPEGKNLKACELMNAWVYIYNTIRKYVCEFIDVNMLI